MQRQLEEMMTFLFALKSVPLPLARQQFNQEWLQLQVLVFVGVRGRSISGVGNAVLFERPPKELFFTNGQYPLLGTLA